MATITKKDLLEALDIEHTLCGDLSGTPYYDEKSAKIKTTYKVVKALIRFAQNEDEISGSSFDIWENATTPCERLKALLEYNVEHLGTDVLNRIENDVKVWVNQNAKNYTKKVESSVVIPPKKGTIVNVNEILNILDPLTPNDPKAQYKYYDTDGYPIAATIQNTLYVFNGYKNKYIPDLDTGIKIACGGDENSKFSDLKTILSNLKSETDKARIMTQIMGAIYTFVDNTKVGGSQDREVPAAQTERIVESNSGESYAEAFLQAAKNYSARSQQGARGLFVVGNNRGNFSHNIIGLGEEAVSQMFKDFARTIPTTSEIAKEVTEVIKTSFEKELTDICVTHQKIETIEEKFNDFIKENNIRTFIKGIEDKIGPSFKEIIEALEDGKKIQEQLAAGQEAQGEDLKNLLEKQEKQDEINRRLDLYMTSTEAAIAENTMQLKNVEKMLLLKEEKDRKDFDAVKKGIEGLGEESKDIKEKIGELLTKDDAFAKFQELQKGNDDIKTLLTKLAEKVCEQSDWTEVRNAISALDKDVTDKIQSAIAASDAKLLGMIMPEIANLKDQNDQILINQETQTTILNSILSGQQNNALQYVAMSEKLDNLTELVNALGTKTQKQSFADNEKTKVVELLENFAKSQKAAFAKVAEKEDLKRIDTGIDSIINMLSDNSITLEMMNEAINSMASQINVMSIDIKRVLEILSQTRIELGTVADCNRCHSAKSMFYKCQVCGYDGKSTNIAPNERGLSFDQTEGLGLLTLTPESNGSIIIDACVRSIAASISSAGDIQQEVKKYRNSARKIVFDACVRGEKKCQNCEREINIVLYDQDGYAKTAKNILEYFPNLEVVSFAKPLDGKPQYILTSGLFYDTTEEQQQKTEKGEGTKKKHTALQYYGGQYIREMKKGVFNIPDVPEEAGRNFLLKLDPNEGLLNRIREISKKPGYGKGYWRK